VFVIKNGKKNDCLETRIMSLGFTVRNTSAVIRKPPVAMEEASQQDLRSVQMETTTFREKYLRPALLGSIDGLITSFVILAGGMAGNVVKSSILVIGVSSLVADGLSMGVSEAISSRAQSGLSFRETFLKGFICLFSFVTLGSFPLLGFQFGPSMTASQILSVSIFVLSLVLVGIFRGCVTREPYWYAVFEVTSLGSAAGGVAYAIASIKF
jgi:VIT1/CCC1 family predicted Fe2+/Mn2+ transporter